MTLTGDGLTIIGRATSGGLASTSRSAMGAIDFAGPSSAQFVEVNAALPAGGVLEWPFITRDGLALSFSITGATDSAQDGIYQSSRTTPSDAFPAATLVTGDATTFAGLSGISDDGLTAFAATATYTTGILTRSTPAQPFASSATTTAPTLAWRVVPTASCGTVVGTCEPGGCQNEDICVWTKQ